MFSVSVSHAAAGWQHVLPCEASELSEGEEAAVDAEMDELRAEMRDGDEADSDGDDIAFYTTVILGGKWTKRKKKVVSDFVLTHAVSKLAKQWAKDHKFPRSKRFSRKLYGPAGAEQLAREFRRRANFFANQYYTAFMNDEEFEHTAETNSAYVEDISYLNWALELAEDDPCWMKVHELRLLMPS